MLIQAKMIRGNIGQVLVWKCVVNNELTGLVDLKDGTGKTFLGYVFNFTVH